MFQADPQLLQYINIQHLNNKPHHMDIHKKKQLWENTYQVDWTVPLYFFFLHLPV